MLGIIGMTLVLTSANGKPIDSWAGGVSRTVLLSLIVGITNGCFRLLMSDGNNISWWIKSMNDKTILADLHRYWNAGTSAYAAVTCGRHFNRVAFASILTFVITS